MSAIGLDPLLSALRDAGLSIGVGEVERLHRVFDLEPRLPRDTSRRLKSVLGAVLVKSRAERETLERICDAWLGQAEAETRTTPEPLTLEALGPSRGRLLLVRKLAGFVKGPPRKQWLTALAVTVAATVAVVLWNLLSGPPTVPTGFTPDAAPPTDEPIEVRRDRFDKWDPEQPPFIIVQDRVWTGWSALSLGLAALLTAGGLWWSLRRRRFLPEPAPPPTVKGPPRVFLTPPPPRAELIDAVQQETLVWGIGRFTTDEPTRRLDVDESVRRTARAGGLLEICFETARRQREVWLWVDETADDPALPRLAGEVASTLAVHGLPVERAGFQGVPEYLVTSGGEVFAPREVDERRDGAIVAVLTDGRVLSRQHTADDRAVRIRALLRLLCCWPRLAFVDFSEGANDLRALLAEHDVETIAPADLPAFLGASRETGPRSLPPAEAVDPIWSGTCALAPGPVDERTAFELHRRLGLESSPWTLRALSSEARSSPGRLRWNDADRVRYVNWLVEAQASVEDGEVVSESVLGQGLDFWEETYDEELKRRADGDDEWAETPAARHLELERALLRLWRRPAEAARELFRIYPGELRKTVRHRLAVFAPRGYGGQGQIRLPWSWDALPAAVRVMFLEMGLGGAMPAESLRRPGRLWLGIGVALGLAAGAFAVAAMKPMVEPEVIGTAEACRPLEGVDEKGMELVRICPGTFRMGSMDNEDEQPVHQVTLSEFWIGKYEVTNRQYPGRPDNDVPVANVTWHEAKAFCEDLGYRLPTEAEWEYAARAGTTTAWSFGDDENDLGRYAWTDFDVHSVGGKDPNPWGLHDMHGNVWEWCSDWYAPYGPEPQVDPVGPLETPLSTRVLRGGSFADGPRNLRSAVRVRDDPENRDVFIGFRCVRVRLRQP